MQAPLGVVRPPILASSLQVSSLLCVRFDRIFCQ